MRTPLLDSIDMSTAATMRALNKPDAAVDAVDALAATLVPGETDETTYAAIATLYDMKRDRAVMQLAKLCEGYGAEMEKREVQAQHAAPLIVEMMRVMDAAVAAQVRALRHRCAAGSARDKAPTATGAR